MLHRGLISRIMAGAIAAAVAMTAMPDMGVVYAVETEEVAVVSDATETEYAETETEAGEVSSDDDMTLAKEKEVSRENDGENLAGDLITEIIADTNVISPVDSDDNSYFVDTVKDEFVLSGSSDEQAVTEDVGDETENLFGANDSDFNKGGTDGYVITEYTGSDTDLVIPAWATGIGDGVFQEKSITSLSFADNSAIKYISKKAFYGCKSLATIDFTNCPSLTEISEEAFSGCSALTTITFRNPNTITTIGKKAFYQDTALDNLTLPDKVASVGEEAFSGCSALKTLTVEASFSGSSSNKNVFKDCALTTVAFGTSNVSVTSIPAYLFSGAGFAAGNVVTLHDDITDIGDHAFDGCKTMNVPKGLDGSGSPKLQMIGEYAFKDCVLFSEIKLPTGVTSLGKGAFSGCTVLKAVSLNDKITNLPDEVFKDCALTETGISFDHITSIGANAFEGNSFVSLSIPDHVIKCGKAAFKANAAMTGVTIGTGLSELSEEMFSNCASLDGVTIPANIEKIEKNAFGKTGSGSGCTDLQTVTLNEGLVEIGDGAFNAASKLSDMTLPESLEIIGASAFKDCSLYNVITIPANVWKLGNMAFMNAKVSKLTIKSEKLTSCGTQIFSGCLLKEVTFPENIETIPSNLFNQATYETDGGITIPATVVSIGKNAFAGAAGYNNGAYFKFAEGSVIETIGEGAFSYRQVFTAITLPKSLKTIGTNAFQNDIKLAEVTIPAAVESIGAGAFSGCSDLAVVTISNDDDSPSVLTTLGKEAFKSDAKLTAFTIPASVETLGDGLFSGCTELASITFEDKLNKPSNLLTISANVFYGCAKLASVDIPAGVVTLGANAFYGCSVLAHVYIPSTVTGIADDSFKIGDSTNYNIFRAGDKTAAYSKIKELNSNTAPANITENICTVTYNYDSEDGGQNSSRNAETYENVIDHAVMYFQPAEKTGYDFIGWYTDEAHTNKIENTAGKSENLTLYAYFVQENPDESMFEWDSSNRITGLSADDKYKNTKWIIIPKKCTAISDSAFAGNTNLVDVSFEEGCSIYTIGESAFSGCKNIRKIDFTDCTKLEKIYDSAFYNCNEISEIKFNSDLKNIGASAFANCKKLTSITLPGVLSELGEAAFAGCSSLSTVEIKSTNLSVTNYSEDTGSTTKVNYRAAAFYGCKLKTIKFSSNDSGITATTIPAALFAYATFDDDEGGVALEISSHIRVVGACAFYGAYNLKSVSFASAADTVTIGEKAFYQMPKLTTVNFGSKVTVIGKEAFKNSKALEGAITFPDSLTEIGESAFEGCTAIGEGTLDNPNVVTVPANVQTVGKAAFKGCTEIYAAAIDSTKMSEIPAEMFSGDIGLRRVTFASGSNITSVGSKAFWKCGVLEECKLGNTVTGIGANAFENCYSLTNFALPENLETIGASAFVNCMELGDITLPVTFTEMGNSAFKGASTSSTENQLVVNSQNLKKSGSSSSPVFEGCVFKEIHFFDGVVTRIPDYFLYKANFKDTVSIDIPASVTYIGSYAMAGDSKTSTKLRVNKVNFAGSGLVEIGSYAFDRTELEEFDMPATVTTAGNYALADNTLLKTVYLSPLLKKIPQYMFANDPLLEHVYYTGTTLTSIENNAFYMCNRLVEFTIPSTVTSLGSLSFASCTSIKTIYIPSSVRSIAKNAFQDDPDLVIVASPDSYAYKFANDNGIEVSTEGVFLITYILNSDDAVNAKDAPTYFYRDGEPVTLPTPTLKGYVFKGWYTDEAMSEGKEITTTEGLTAALTVYAKWVEDWANITYTVKFDANLTGAKSPESIKVEGDSTFTLPTAADMAMDYYVLTGWCTVKNPTTDEPGVLYEPGKTVKELASKNNATVTLYGQWKGNTYNITWITPYGVDKGDDNPAGYTVSGSKLTFKDAQVNSGDVTFKSWTGVWTSGNNKGIVKSGMKEIAANTGGDLTMYAIVEYTSGNYTIRLDTNGGKFKSGLNSSAISASTNTNIGFMMPLRSDAVARDGFVFKGWGRKKTKVQSGYACVDEDDAPEFTQINKNISSWGKKVGKTKTVTLYAVWETKTYNEKTSIYGFTDSSTKADGYTYFPETDSEDGTKGGGYYTAKQMKTVKKSKSKRTAAKALKLLVPKKAGYTFSEWEISYTDASGSAKTITNKNSVPKNIASDVTVTPVWKPNSYKVTFVGNGGKVKSKKSYNDGVKYSYIGEVTAPAASDMTAAVDKKTGSEKTFVGWGLAKNATEPVVNAGDKKAMSALVSGKLALKKTGTVKLYAIWK